MNIYESRVIGFSSGQVTLNYTDSLRSYKLRPLKEKFTSNTKRVRRNFTDEFKQQVVQLYLSGKEKPEIREQYDLYASTLDNWIKQHQETGSFKSNDNLSDDEKELKEL